MPRIDSLVSPSDTYAYERELRGILCQNKGNPQIHENYLFSRIAQYVLFFLRKTSDKMSCGLKIQTLTR